MQILSVSPPAGGRCQTTVW